MYMHMYTITCSVWREHKHTYKQTMARIRRFKQNKFIDFQRSQILQSAAAAAATLQFRR